MGSMEQETLNRGQAAARAWLAFLWTTSKERWEQVWELEKLWRLPPPADE